MKTEQLEQLLAEVRQTLAGIDGDQLNVVAGSQFFDGRGWWETDAQI